MYCDYYKEHVDEDDCYECNEPCKKNVSGKEKTEAREAALERLRGSELAMKIRASLAGTLTIGEDCVDSLLINLFDDAFRIAESQFGQLLGEIARTKAVEYIDHKAKKVLDEQFDKALGEKVLVLSKDGTAQDSVIQKLILNQMKKFFAEKDSYNSRNNVEATIEKAIGKVVDAQVKTALEEITAESIEKFNTMAMKKMMSGMVGAIQGDKRLLAVLGVE